MYFFIKIIRPLLKAQKKYKPKNVCLPLTHVFGLFGIRPLVAFFYYYYNYFLVFFSSFNVKFLLYSIESTINLFLYFLACNKINKKVYDTPYINFLGYKKT